MAPTAETAIAALRQVEGSLPHGQGAGTEVGGEVRGHRVGDDVAADAAGRGQERHPWVGIDDAPGTVGSDIDREEIRHGQETMGSRGRGETIGTGRAGLGEGETLIANHQHGGTEVGTGVGLHRISHGGVARAPR